MQSVEAHLFESHTLTALLLLCMLSFLPQLRITGPAPGIPVGRAAEVWYPSAALWDARLMKEGKQVQICTDKEAIMSTSRAAGIAIDVEKDAVRAACAGKVGTILAVDKGDNTAKVRVATEPGKAATLWFAIAACEPKS